MLGCCGEFGCFAISGLRVMNDGIGRRVGLECCIALFIVYAGSGEEKMKVVDVGVEVVVGLVQGVDLMLWRFSIFNYFVQVG